MDNNIRSSMEVSTNQILPQALSSRGHEAAIKQETQKGNSHHTSRTVATQDLGL